MMKRNENYDEIKTINERASDASGWLKVFSWIISSFSLLDKSIKLHSVSTANLDWKNQETIACRRRPTQNVSQNETIYVILIEQN